MVYAILRFSFVGLALAAAMLLAPPPRTSLAADECGTGSMATAGLTRFAAYAAANHANYVVGTVVQVSTTSGTPPTTTTNLHRATGAITGAPGATAQMGWSAPLAATEFAANEVVCINTQTSTSTPPYDANIEYSEGDLAIVYRRTGATGAAESIAHTGDGGEIHILSGSISRPLDANDGAAVSIAPVSGTDAVRLVIASGVSIANLDTDSGNGGIDVAGGGNIFLDVAGTVSAVDNTAITAAISAASATGDIIVNVSGGVSVTGTGGAGIGIAISNGGTGNTAADISGDVSTTLGGAISVSNTAATSVGNISLNMSGAASTTGGGANAIQVSHAGTSGNVDVDATGGATTEGARSHAVSISVSDSASTGDITLNVNGVNSTMGANSDVITIGHAGTGGIDADIDGGTLTASGMQGTSDAVIHLSGVGGPITLDIAADVTARARGMATRAIYLSSMNRTASAGSTRTLDDDGDANTALTMFAGNRISNLGTIIGDFVALSSNDLFENANGATFDGTFSAGAGDDEFRNEGMVMLDGDWDFSSGSDLFVNQGGTVVFDGVAAGGQIELTGLETFTQTSGTLRFRVDLSAGTAPTDALLDLGVGTLSAAPMGVIELVIVGGDLDGRTTPVILPIIGVDTSGLDISGLTSTQGALSLNSGGTAIQLTISTLIAAASRGIDDCEGEGRVVCSSEDGYANGIRTTFSDLVISYGSTATNTPFIRHAGASGQIHILSGAGAITKTGTQADGAAVSVIASSGGVIRISTAAGTTISNTDTDASNQGILAQHPSGDIFMNIAGDVSTVGGGFAIAVGAIIQGGGADATGNISMIVSGNTSTTGTESAAIWARTSGVGNIDVDINGGTHSVAGVQDSGDAVVSLNTSGRASLDIASGATVTTLDADGDPTLASRAIFIISSGGRATNRGTVMGEFHGVASGGILFENLGTFAGAIQMSGGNDRVQNSGMMTISGSSDFGDGDDRVQNSGMMTLSGSSDFGAGADEFRNEGSLTIETGYSFANLETFTNSASITGALTVTGSTGIAITNWRDGSMENIATGSGADTIVNHGEITGSISTGGGNDLVRNRGREAMTLSGSTDFGEGEDSLVNSERLIFAPSSSLARLEVLTNLAGGVVSGDLAFSGGEPVVSNAGTWTIAADTDFAAAATSSFTNSGNLIVDHAARGGQLVFSNLGAFSQTGGNLDFVYDATGGALPTEALLSIGGAAGTFSGGVIRLRQSAASREAGGSIPGSGVIPLITGTNLTPGPVEGIESQYGDVTVSADGVLQITLRNQNTMRILQSYDALLQTGWYADRALGLAMLSSECDPMLKKTGDMCAWSRFAGRITRHDPSTNNAEYDEDAYAFMMGLRFTKPRWHAVLVAGYEGSQLDIESPTLPVFPARANRFLVGFTVSTRGEPLLDIFDIDAQFRIGYTSYKSKRRGRNLANIATGRPELVTATGAVAIGKRAVLDTTGVRDSAMPFFSKWVFVSRAEIGVMGQRVDKFDETGNSGSLVLLSVEDINEVLAYASTFMEIRGLGEFAGGALTSWLRLGADVFLGRPHSDLRASSDDGEQLARARGTMERSMLDLGIGVGYKIADRMEINLGYEGGISLQGNTNIHYGALRINYAF